MSNIFETVKVTETKHINTTDLVSKFKDNYTIGKLFFLAGWSGKFFEVILDVKPECDLPENPTLTTVKNLLTEHKELLYFIATANRVNLSDLQVMKIAPTTNGQESPLKSLVMPM